jgi:competence protein ComEA
MLTRTQQGVVLLLTLLLLFFFFLTFSPFPPNLGKPINETRPFVSSSASDQEVWIEVDGEVKNRGVWPAAKGETIRDVLKKAGGTQGNLSLPADLMNTKMDKNIRVHVIAGKEGQGSVLLQPLDPPKMKALSIPVNINTANAEDLNILPGVGPITAQAIIAFRETHGSFSALEDLLQVKGIGPKKFASLRPHITIQD